MEGVLSGAAGRPSGRLLECGQSNAILLACIHGGGCNAGYFDLPGFSVAKAALARGFDVLLLDRPGHGGSPASIGVSAIGEAVRLLPDLISRAMTARQSPALALIGHSIGGAVALTLTAAATLPVRALTVSGIGRVPSPAALAWLRDEAARDPEPSPSFFFGAEGTYDWRGPIALRRIAEPWTLRDVQEILSDWPARFDGTAEAIDVPVGFYLAEHERIWCATPEALADAASRFVHAPRVDAAILPDGGHLYEIHRRGPDLVERQLDFIAAACGTD